MKHRTSFLDSKDAGCANFGITFTGMGWLSAPFMTTESSPPTQNCRYDEHILHAGVHSLI